MVETISRTSELQRGSFYVRDVRVARASDLGLPQVFDEFGEVQRYTRPDGEKITLLPGASVPVAALFRERWADLTQMGNARSVQAVRSLDDGTAPGIVVKAPERRFSGADWVHRRGEVWWGGSKSGERQVRIAGHPVVEEQSVWEAAILLELGRAGFRAEQPQAILEKPSGCMELVVAEITAPLCGVKSRGLGYSELLAEVRKQTGLVPVDASGFNSIKDEQGYERIIDVNRWLWPPHTDEYRARLLEVVKEAAT